MDDGEGTIAFFAFHFHESDFLANVFGFQTGNRLSISDTFPFPTSSSRSVCKSSDSHISASITFHHPVMLIRFARRLAGKFKWFFVVDYFLA